MQKVPQIDCIHVRRFNIKKEKKENITSFLEHVKRKRERERKKRQLRLSFSNLALCFFL